MGWKIIPQSLVKKHRGNHKVFTSYEKAKAFLDQHKDSWITQTVWDDREGFSEWKVFFADYEGMAA